MNFVYYKDLRDVSSENTKIHSFYQFVNKLHNLSDCRKRSVTLEIFVGCLRSVQTKRMKSKDYFFFLITQTFLKYSGL